MRIIKEFPEVKMVVGKTGAAEIPTDPMPPEATDMMIILKPIKTWESGKSYDQLADDIMEKLEVIPGVFFEKNQPIQMRFNELMTGIRQDVAVKIFGENMDTLLYYGNKVSKIVSSVPGATEPSARSDVAAHPGHQCVPGIERAVEGRTRTSARRRDGRRPRGAPHRQCARVSCAP